MASWAQSLRHRDPPTFALIWGTPTFILALVGFGSISFVGYAIGFWAAPYAIRTFVVPIAAAGGDIPWYATKAFAALMIGGWGAAGGFIGIVTGGWLGDRVKRTNPGGRVLVALLAVLVPGPFIAMMVSTHDVRLFLPALHPDRAVRQRLCRHRGGDDAGPRPAPDARRGDGRRTSSARRSSGSASARISRARCRR